MSHVLIAWELGEDLGHLSGIALVARELIARGHKVTVALKDLSKASLFFTDDTIAVMQSPVWLPRQAKPRLTKTNADILAYRGYGSVDGLTMLIKAWSSLIRATSPDIIVGDYAPTALLAARRDGIPRVVLSESFSFPEPGSPGQDICPWVPAPTETVRRNEQRIADNINAVARALAFPGVDHLPDVFACDHAFITELPVFDSIRNQRQNATYVGAAPSTQQFQPVDWGSRPGKRVFIYLKPGRPHVEAALRLLRDSNAVVRGYFPGRLPEDLQKAQGDNFALSNHPANVIASLEEADMAVFHGSIGTLCQIALSGKPTFALPTQIEQTRNARIIRTIGNGDWVDAKDDHSELERRLHNGMMSNAMKKNAIGLAEAHAGFQNFPFSDTICNGIEGLIRG
jgi:UDP:flavonoid glycosyltransferase YjiC (YdhE family)